ncbi:uncharacterized protein FOMMEDRAFT_167489 [Fomitiporia mediterranea MF3/22]|uniref:uncharacterized protein n=1 Tax=Fomitiporia mediterranea (strain MF3/22) TaxID=694068 RepID=UPI00044097A7|nr:uncharacterized protein FOMMEDRAFT_167489 [Fomitiporia mediterranea MF3/22]EJD04266.1 hypothetical protein FOMMEDRAFT_167489 [Fomitiporia mediterranea MF3/22]
MSSPMALDVPPNTPASPSDADTGGVDAGFLPQVTWNLDLLSSVLPREIISEIFAQACDVENAADADATFEITTLAPLRLSHVSRLWREVAISTPRLWTHLQVVARRADITSALELTKLWVPRCKQRPLIIDVTFQDRDGPFIIYPVDSVNLFRVITKTAVLLRKGIEFGSDKAYFETHVKAGSSGAMPIIEEKYLWYYGVDDTPRKEELPSIPLFVRGIRRAVDEFGFGYHEPLTDSLTRLELLDTNGVTCLSTTELLIILAEFPQLRYVSAYLNHGDAPPAERVTALKLLTFKLAWGYTTDPGELFDNLYAPSITEMEVSGDVPASAAWNNLYDFFERSRPPIKTFALEHFDATSNVTHLADCLDLCESLESLWLENCVVDDEFIARIGRRSALSETSVLSRLRIFGIVSADDVTGDCLVQVLRNADTTRLREVFVFDCDLVLQEHCDAIEEYFRETTAVETIIVTPRDAVD